MFVCLTSHEETAPPSFTSRTVDLLCGATAAELHNSVDLLCGTTAAETFEKLSKNRSIVDLQQTLEICTLYEDQQTFNALRRQNKRPQQTLEDARITT